VPRTRDDFQRWLAAGRGRIGWAVQELIGLVRPLFEGCHQASLAVESFRTTAAGPPAPKTLLGATVGGDCRRRSDARTAASRRPQSPPASAPGWQYAIDDMRDQIARLMDAESFAKTAWDWLRQYPRYFRAISQRLENLRGGVARDRQKFQEFQPQWQLYLEQARHHQTMGIVDPELLHLRWMLEEYRVSLFAQRLGTAVPVSAKRLDEQWAKLQKW
jgi:ATP-dependent helicase HrpA